MKTNCPSEFGLIQYGLDIGDFMSPVELPYVDSFGSDVTYWVNCCETGSKLKTAVTGKVKAGSKSAKRRKSYCARSAGQLRNSSAKWLPINPATPVINTFFIILPH